MTTPSEDKTVPTITLRDIIIDELKEMREYDQSNERTADNIIQGINDLNLNLEKPAPDLFRLSVNTRTGEVEFGFYDSPKE